MARLRFALLLLALFALVVSSGGGLFDITCGEEDEEPVLFSSYEATEVTGTSARLNARCTRCRIEGGAQVCFYVSWEGVPDVYTDYQTVNKMQDFSATITGLVPGTEYYFFATYDGQDDERFMTQQMLAMSNLDRHFTTASLVETLDAVYPSSTMAILWGNLPDLGGASSVEVYFMWGENPGLYTHETPRQTMDHTGTFSAVITGPFNIGSTYYFVARVGATGQGSEKSFTVL